MLKKGEPRNIRLGRDLHRPHKRRCCNKHLFATEKIKVASIRPVSFAMTKFGICGSCGFARELVGELHFKIWKSCLKAGKPVGQPPLPYDRQQMQEERARPSAIDV